MRRNVDRFEGPRAKATCIEQIREAMSQPRSLLAHDDNQDFDEIYNEVLLTIWLLSTESPTFGAG